MPIGKVICNMLRKGMQELKVAGNLQAENRNPADKGGQLLKLVLATVFSITAWHGVLQELNQGQSRRHRLNPHLLALCQEVDCHQRFDLRTKSILRRKVEFIVNIRMDRGKCANGNMQGLCSLEVHLEAWKSGLYQRFVTEY